MGALGTANGLSNAEREMLKRQRIRTQIERNMGEGAETVSFNGLPAKLLLMAHVDSYSTKFMTPRDQIALAVDQIMVPEVRAALTPDDDPHGLYAECSNPYAYTSSLSLNDGDWHAVDMLCAQLVDTDAVVFKFDDETVLGDEYEHISAGEDDKELSDDGSGALVLTKFDKSSHDDDYLEEAIVFDLYSGVDGSVIDAPGSQSESVSIVVERSEEYTEKLKWSYNITFHCFDPKKPKDTRIKNGYMRIQRFMRAATSTVGIVPSQI